MRRMFTPVFLWSLALLLGFIAPVYGETFEDGKDYFTLKTPAPVRDKTKVEVVELFWYGCPSCRAFDPLVSAWKAKQPEFVDFWHSPAVFSKVWKVHAKAFYAADALGVGEEMHQPLFDALYKDKKSLPNENALAKFFSGYGIEEEKFRKAYNSFSMNPMVEQAVKRSKNYGVKNVPVMVVNGKYWVEVRAAGSYSRLLEIVDYLVEKERQAQGS